MKKKAYIFYIAVFLILCAIPSAGLLFGGSEESTENRKLAEAPVLKTEDGWNTRFLSDAGAYFEDHFAFRNEWVSSYGLLQGKVFGVSAQNSVIVGTDNWLYYKDSLRDYQGSELLTDRQLFDIAHSLAMIQEYAWENDISFAFTVAPNKNSLYGEHMPYYYQKFRSGEKNLDRLVPYLEAEDVNYVDLYGALRAQDEVLYHERDSHWNNKGAAFAADQILNALDWEHVSYADRPYEMREDFEGDLDVMVYPSAVTPEAEIYYDPMPDFEYVEEVESNFSPRINTWGDSDYGSLVMYRDSFGNALLPFMAEAFCDAYFSRGVPYQMLDLFEYEADNLVIERAERFLPDMAKNPPMMQAPIRMKALGLDYSASYTDLAVEDQGLYTKITGVLPEESYETDSRIYILVNGLLPYEAFPVSLEDGREGFQMLIVTDLLEEEENVFGLALSGPGESEVVG